MENGGAEQDPEDWWRAMCTAIKKVLAAGGVSPRQIAGLSFCGQMQGLVLVDEEGRPVRRSMSYMDNRAKEELRADLGRGIKIAGSMVIS